MLACSKIWLNLPMDHHHFGYITKLTKKTLIASVLLISILLLQVMQMTWMSLQSRIQKLVILAMAACIRRSNRT